jgi:hypothetical protein
MPRVFSLFLLSAAALPAQAIAAPAYMTCTFVSDGGARSEVKITADEAAGTVDVFVPSTGFNQRLPGTFTADRLLFKDKMLDYAISRVDLTAVRTIRMIDSTDKGKCSIDPAPKRAF